MTTGHLADHPMIVMIMKKKKDHLMTIWLAAWLTTMTMTLTMATMTYMVMRM